MNKINKGLVTGSIIAVILAVLFMFCTETILSGTESVGTTLGKISQKPLTKGFHFVNPLTSYENFSLRVYRKTWENLPMPAGDKLVTTADVTVTGRFLAGYTPNILENSGTSQRFMQKHFDQQVPGFIVKAAMLHAPASGDFYEKATFDKISADVKTWSNEYLNPLGYRIDSISFTDPRLPAEIIASVKATIKRTEEVERQEQELKIKDLEAQEKTMESKANAASAEFDSAAILTMANANAASVRVAAEAEAYANKQRSESVTPELIEYMNAQAEMKWDGAKPKTVTVLSSSAQALKLIQ